jgi:hypothetical protein
MIRSGKCAIADPVAIHITVALETSEPLEVFGTEHLAAVEFPGGILEGIRHPVVHAQIEITHHKHGRLKSFRQIEGIHGHVEAFRYAAGQQHDVLRVAVRAVDDRKDVRLLRTGRQPGAGPDARDIEDHDRNLGVVGQSDEFVHQRDAGTCRRSHRPRTRPARADSHADCGEFIFSLDDRIRRLAVLFVAVLRHVVGQRFAKA